MPKKLLIASESCNLYTTKRLLEEGGKLKYSTKWHNPYESSLNDSLPLNKTGLYLLRTTGIRYDDFDLCSAKHYSLKNYKITNPITPVTNFRSKELQSLFLKEHQLNSIPTLNYRGKLTDEILHNLKLLSPSGEYVLKMSRGNQGIGVNLINSFHSLVSFLETFHAMKDQRFIIQPFIKHTKELRVFIIKNEIHAIIERQIGKDDFRGNSHRSSGKLTTRIPSIIKDEIIKAATLSELDYCGIDLIYDKHEITFLEINPVPGFEQVEKLTKKNIARELILQLQ
jgi:ribosomal protein S6--L-glutamate ligase